MSVNDLLVRDPIHGFIDLRRYPFVEDIVEQPVFQRLRHLKQLGFSFLIYPSATHNRFSHSLGAMHVFWRLLDRLGDGLVQEDAEELRKIGTAVTLLHDIGHGPFSHVAESVFDFKHVNMTKELIARPPISEILEKTGVDPADLKRILDGTTTPKMAILSQLVSSQLDADRLDFLVRDTYFTGVGFGNVDLERIINTMILCDREPLVGQATSLFKARFSLESYVLTRHLMYQGVYFHKATRGAELMLRNVMRRARAIADKIDMPRELISLKENRPLEAEELAALDDNLIYAQLHRWRACDDFTLSQLCDRIITRKLLKAVDIPPDKTVYMFEEGLKKVQSIASEKGLDPDYFCPFDKPSDTPYKPYSPKGRDDKTNVITNIFLMDGAGNPQEISQVSPVVNSISAASAKDFLRIYCPEAMREDVSKILK